MRNIARRMQARRNYREFNRVLGSASPAVQQELLAAATRGFYRGV